MQPFERIVTTHGAMVLRVCRAVVGPVDAEDAWSETFLSALRSYPDLPADANVEAWLVRVAHRKAVDITRRRSRLPLPVDEVPEQGAAPDDPHEHDDLYGALSGLPEKQRLCVAYHHLGGLAFAEVAALVGGTEAAARRASADGIVALRGRLLDRQGATS